MTEQHTLTSEEQLQLARRNIARLKEQAAAPEPLAPLPHRPASRRSKRGGRHNLNPTSKATLVHTLGGSALFVKPPSLLDSGIDDASTNR